MPSNATPSEYRMKAAECRHEADIHPGHREMFLRLADHWERMAERAARYTAVNSVVDGADHEDLD